MARTRGRTERELPEAPPQYDVYTGLLGISLLATIVGLIFVFMDYSDYKGTVPKPKTPASIYEQPGPAQGGAAAGPAAAPKEPG
jgi:hypothetical protein